MDGFIYFHNNIKKGLIYIAFWEKVKTRQFKTIVPYNKEAMQGKIKPKSKGHWDKVPCHIEIDINPIRSDGKCHSGWKLSIDGEEVFCKSFKIELPESGSLVSYTMEGYAGAGWVEDE